MKTAISRQPSAFSPNAPDFHLTATLYTLRFSDLDVHRCGDLWGSNCGPAALAYARGVTLDQIRPFLGSFEQRGYMSPTHMRAAIAACGLFIYEERRPNAAGLESLPNHGIARIQWCGPWTKQGVNTRWAYGHTHWIGSFRRSVFDVNSGLTSFEDWASKTVPFLLEHHPRSDGGWLVTHAWTLAEADPFDACKPHKPEAAA